MEKASSCARWILQKAPTKNYGRFSVAERKVVVGAVAESLNEELMARWSFTVSIAEKLWWDEETKVDHDGLEKRFIYLDAICGVASGEPSPVNDNETLEWVKIAELKEYDINPPTRVLLERLGYLAKSY